MNQEKHNSSNRPPESGTQLELNKMGTMPVGRLMISMSLPAMFSMIIHALYNIVDSIFVGMIGQSALTAVTLIFPIQMLLISVGVGTGVGLNSLISRRLGERNFIEANLAASHGMMLSIINWALFAIFGFFFSEMFVRAFSESASIVPDATAYCAIVTIFSLFIFIQINVEKILQATGNMILPMICGLTGAVTNIILDPILIFGLLGAPELGVAGAAAATVVGQFLSMSLGLLFLFTKKHEVKIKIKNFRFNWYIIKSIYNVGLPAIVMQSIGSVMLVGFNSILISFSDAAVAVLGVYFRLQSFIFMPVFGLTQGSMPIFGYNFGAKKKDRLLHAFKLSMIIAISIMLVGMLIFQIFPIPLLKMFNASPEMLHIGVRALRSISICFVFAGIGIISSTMFQATGHGTLSLYMSVLRQIVLILPLAWLLARFIGLDAVWFSFPMAEIFSLAATVLFLRYIYRKEIKDLGSE
ncbi:MATE family efflux transporter [Sinanaerobacter chloroacetimidivorans]|jgi:putative MATE family efflux protein|uniref:MATE family efflux transporter n=1 Tax=Sinanaerobacter chloroacetimidivorans TaxID=2818044 RepID=A0A8J7VX83_9FIRM|nr:MATE family efflux transporter [Sinanaerobacter chloroacetimidivorans]MBR0596732.1 MATE family efflux transporter [Sinanaerobacter chloroacetimidivorans]